MAGLVSLHLLASVIWIGSMFFSLLILRPVCIQTLEAPLRLKLMHGVMSRFFSWVWVIVTLLLVTGYWMTFGVIGNISGAGWHVKTMLVLGNTMAIFFLIAFFGPFQKATEALQAGNNPEAGANFERIRKLIIANFTLGIVLVLTGSLGRYMQ